MKSSERHSGHNSQYAGKVGLQAHMKSERGGRSAVSDSATPWTGTHLALCPWESPGKNTGDCPPPGDLPNPGVKPRPPTLQADSLPAEPRGKPMNTGVRSLSILQGIFPSKGSNLGLLHCTLILHQLRHHGPVFITKPLIKMQIYIFESSRIHQRSHWPKSFVSLLWSFLLI